MLENVQDLSAWQKLSRGFMRTYYKIVERDYAHSPSGVVSRLALGSVSGSSKFHAPQVSYKTLGVKGKTAQGQGRGLVLRGNKEGLCTRWHVGLLLCLILSVTELQYQECKVLIKSLDTRA